nr:MAG TPA: hypothetical protein [Caudoviricetes sp.]
MHSNSRTVEIASKLSLVRRRFISYLLTGIRPSRSLRWEYSRLFLIKLKISKIVESL